MAGDKVLLTKAVDAATRLLPAFETNTGIPLAAVNLMTFEEVCLIAKYLVMRCRGRAKNWGWAGGSILSELGSIILEFQFLSDASGDQKFVNAVCAFSATTI